MINKIGIQNFRVFGDEVSQFKLAPITVLTGCNSSGKSSVIKSMMLLKNYLKESILKPLTFPSILF
jgi:predicted ATPase